MHFTKYLFIYIVKIYNINIYYHKNYVIIINIFKLIYFKFMIDNLQMYLINVGHIFHFLMSYRRWFASCYRRLNGAS